MTQNLLWYSIRIGMIRWFDGMKRGLASSSFNFRFGYSNCIVWPFKQNKTTQSTEAEVSTVPFAVFAWWFLFVQLLDVKEFHILSSNIYENMKMYFHNPFKILQQVFCCAHPGIRNKRITNDQNHIRHPNAKSPSALFNYAKAGMKGLAEEAYCS